MSHGANLQELIETKNQLERHIENICGTTSRDDNTYLERFRVFITTNSYVKQTLSDYNPEVKIDSFIVCVGNAYIVRGFVPPKDETQHISCILGTLNYFCQKGLPQFVRKSNAVDYSVYIKKGLQELLNPLFNLLLNKICEQITRIDVQSNPSIQIQIGDNVARDKNQVNGDMTLVDKSKTISKTKNVFKIIKQQKQGFIAGIISSVIVGLISWGIIELIKFLIGG